MAQKSAVLDHMEKANATTAKCKLCRKELSITGGQTSGLKRHLEMQYAIDAKVKVSDDRQPKMASFLSGSHSVSATGLKKLTVLSGTWCCPFLLLMCQHLSNSYCISLCFAQGYCNVATAQSDECRWEKCEWRWGRIVTWYCRGVRCRWIVRRCQRWCLVAYFCHTFWRFLCLWISNEILISCIIRVVQSGPEKIAQSLMHRHFATICSRITRFGNTKNGQLLNIVIKYSLFGSWQWNYLKSINTGDMRLPWQRKS